MIFKKTIFLLMVTLLFVCGLAAQNSSAERDRQELIRLTKEISSALVEKDTATLEHLIYNDFVLLSAGNKSFRKAELVKFWTAQKDSQDASESSVPSEIQVFLYDQTAVVIDTITDTERNQNGETVIQTKAFDVWRKTKKGWRWIASWETLLPTDKK